MKGRKPDPKRATRGTGNRPKPGEAKKATRSTAIVPVPAHGKAKQVATSEPFPPPATLPEPVVRIWRAAVEDLGGANHMRESFLPSLEAYCTSVWLHAQAVANIQEFGALVVAPNGAMAPNPMIKVQKDAAATMLRFADSLGLTPSARIRLGLMEVTGMSLLAGLNAALDGGK